MLAMNPCCQRTLTSPPESAHPWRTPLRRSTSPSFRSSATSSRRRVCPPMARYASRRTRLNAPTPMYPRLPARRRSSARCATRSSNPNSETNARSHQPGRDEVRQGHAVTEPLAFDPRDRTSQRPRREQDVGVREQDPVAGGRGRPLVHGVRLAEPPRGQHVDARDPQRRVRGRQLAQDAAGRVLGAIVDRDHLVRGVVLRQQRRDRAAHAGRFVPAGDDHRQLGPGAAARRERRPARGEGRAAPRPAGTARRTAPRARATRAGRRGQSCEAPRWSTAVSLRPS